MSDLRARLDALRESVHLTCDHQQSEDCECPRDIGVLVPPADFVEALALIDESAALRQMLVRFTEDLESSGYGQGCADTCGKPKCRLVRDARALLARTGSDRDAKT